jgi:hypothetical protein
MMMGSIKMQSTASPNPSNYQQSTALARKHGTIIRYRREPRRTPHQCASHRAPVFQLSMVSHTTGQRYSSDNLASIALPISRPANHRKHLLGHHHHHTPRLPAAIPLARGLVPTPCRKSTHLELDGDGMSLQYQHRLHDYHPDDSSYAYFILGSRLGNGRICDVVD